jgi:hypothetical protein
VSVLSGRLVLQERRELGLHWLRVWKQLRSSDGLRVRLVLAAGHDGAVYLVVESVRRESFLVRSNFEYHGGQDSKVYAAACFGRSKVVQGSADDALVWAMTHVTESHAYSARTPRKRGVGHMRDSSFRVRVAVFRNTLQFCSTTQKQCRSKYFRRATSNKSSGGYTI